MAGSHSDRRPEPVIHPSIEVRKVSEREFCDHLGIEDEKRFIGLQHIKQSRMIWLLLEPSEAQTCQGGCGQGEATQCISPDSVAVAGTKPPIITEPGDMQTTGTMPQIASNATYGKGKGGAKTPKGGGKKKCG